MSQMKVRTVQAFSVLTNPDAASLKRIAWAFGCAKKGSDEEARLHEILVERVRREDQERRIAPLLDEGEPTEEDLNRIRETIAKLQSAAAAPKTTTPASEDAGAADPDALG